MGKMKKEGNEFWKQRSKHGRDKLFATPTLLWAAASEYFTWCDKNPWIKKEAIKSGELAGETMDVPTIRPYTLTGLCSYLECSESYFRAFKQQERDNKDGFITVIERISNVIYVQQFEGAAVGAFNSNIIARALGLTDKQGIDHTSDSKPIKTVTIFQLPDNGRDINLKREEE